MFKKVVMVGIILFALVSCSKKEDNSRLITKYIQIDKVINTGCQIEGAESSLIFAVFHNYIYINPKLSNSCLELKLYNIKNNIFSKQIYNIEQSITDSIRYFIGKAPSDMDANSNFIFLLYNRFLLTIDKYNSKNTYLTYLNEPFQKLKVVNGQIILCRAYNYHPLDAKTPIRIAEYDIKSRKITNFIDPVPDAIEFSHFTPLNWIDISQNGDIALTNTLKAEHNIYNKKMMLKQKLTFRPKNWEDIDITVLNQVRKTKSELSPLGIIQLLTKTTDGNGCRVISINFANDSTILAFYTGAPSSDKANFVRYCNVWKKKNNKWALFDKELRDALPDSTSKLSRNNFPFMGSMNTVKFNHNKAYYITISPNQDKLFQFGKPYSALKKEIDKYFAGDKLFYQLYIFDCRF